MLHLRLLMYCVLTKYHSNVPAKTFMFFPMFNWAQSSQNKSRHFAQQLQLREKVQKLREKDSIGLKEYIVTELDSDLVRKNCVKTGKSGGKIQRELLPIKRRFVSYLGSIQFHGIFDKRKDRMRWDSFSYRENAYFLISRNFIFGLKTLKTEENYGKIKLCQLKFGSHTSRMLFF